ncbi:MAG: hypothetical protein AUI14_23055 [Actinobacteria bacterium 13_2_20CM_2_71_6]|nr:MAG: hypothetical protein AUI14_23055 [Actinobacteria bacterium 13_2_20CM_2_71_6]
MNHIVNSSAALDVSGGLIVSSRALNLANALNETLAAVYDNILALEQFFAVAGDLSLDYYLAYTLDTDRTNMRDVARKLGYYLDLDLAQDQASAAALVRDLAHAHDLARVFVGHFADGRARYLALRLAEAGRAAYACVEARELVNRLAVARKLLRRLVREYAAQLAVAGDFTRSRALSRAARVDTTRMPANVQGRERLPFAVLVVAALQPVQGIRPAPCTERRAPVSRKREGKNGAAHADSGVDTLKDGAPRTGTGVVLAVLGFAIAFPVVAHWAGVDAATVTATLAALPGILLAAFGRR